MLAWTEAHQPITADLVSTDGHVSGSRSDGPENLLAAPLAPEPGRAVGCGVHDFAVGRVEDRSGGSLSKHRTQLIGWP